MLISKTSDSDLAKIYGLLSDGIGILGVIVGLSILGIGMLRRQGSGK